MKYYRVKYGYGKDEFYSVEESELAKAIKAQGDSSIFICSEGTISGNNIMAIMPDYNRALGYKRDYAMTGEDYDELPRSVQREHTELLEQTKMGALGNRNLKELHD